MARCRLVLSEAHFGWQIAWLFPEEEDLGAVLGEDEYTEGQLKTALPEDRSHILATITVSRTAGVRRQGHRGYFWETRSEVNAALKAANHALKNDTGAPWPEWAVKAQAEGWKPPKGWKP